MTKALLCLDLSGQIKFISVDLIYCTEQVVGLRAAAPENWFSSTKGLNNLKSHIGYSPTIYRILVLHVEGTKNAAQTSVL